ncbi:hypothetical protein EMIT093MI4_20001 [Pseudomonas sp. IT-93MI4]
MNLKEFSVSTAPEVGRIIDFLNLPSTVNFSFLSTTYRSVKKRTNPSIYRQETAFFYIEAILKALHQP